MCTGVIAAEILDIGDALLGLRDQVTKGHPSDASVI